jgi:flavin-dependent dehydrogenase
METGMLAAQALITARQQGLDEDALAAHYAQALQQLQPKYDFYEKANWVNRYPWFAEIVIRKAAHSAPWRQSLSQLLQEEVASRPLTLGRVIKRLWA